MAAVALACLVPAVPAAGADFVMKFGTPTMNEAQHQFLKFYKEEVEKASGGRIEGRGQVGGGRGAATFGG